MRMLHWGDCKAIIEQQLVEIKKLNKELDEYHSYINDSVDQLKRRDEIFKIQYARIQELEQENAQLSQANNTLAQRAKNLEMLDATHSCNLSLKLEQERIKAKKKDQQSKKQQNLPKSEELSEEVSA